MGRLSRRLAASLVVAIVGSCICCTTGAAAETVTDSVRFTAEGLPSPTSGAVEALAPREVLKAFLKHHPNYVVDPFAMPAVEGSSQDSGPLMAIAAGIPPHVMSVNFRQSSTYLAQGFLEPLDVLLARVQSKNADCRKTDRGGNWLADPTPAEISQAVEQILKRVPKPAHPVVYRVDESANDKTPHVYAIPLANVVSALIYRKDLFLGAGLDPDNPPKNWDEWIAAARKIHDPKKQIYGHMFRGYGQTVSWGIYDLLASNGAEAMRQEPDGKWRAAYGNRGAAEAVYLAWRMLHEPFEKEGYDKPIPGCAFLASTGPDRLRWDQGRVGMQFSSIREELIATFDPNLVGIAPIPDSPKGISAPQVNATMCGVFTGSSPEQKLAAFRYAWFVTSPEAKKIRTAVYVENGFGKFVSPDMLQEFGYDRLLRQVSRSWQETFTKSIQSGVPEPWGKNTQYIYRWMSEPINDVLDKENFGIGKDRETALNEIEALLVKSANEVNAEVLSPVPAAEMNKRRMVAIPAIIIVGLAFFFGLRHVWKSFSRATESYFGKRHWRKYVWGYALLVPVAVLTFMWAYAPLGMGLSISFLDYQIIKKSAWVGIDNFANVLFDVRFWVPLWRTFYFVALTIGLGFWPPILLAILLQEIPTGTARYIFRTIFYLPAVVSGLVVMFLWRQLYDPTEYGVLNQLLLTLNGLPGLWATIVKLTLLGFWLSLVFVLLWLPFKMDEIGKGLRISLFAAGTALLILTLMPFYTAITGGAGVMSVLKPLVGSFAIKPLKWTQDPSLAMLCVVLPHVWAGAGPGCILYLAALKSVPDELYEAADIDAAGHWHKVFYIVVPFLKYIIVVQFVGAVIGSFKGGVEMIMVMTGGGPNNATNILALEMFNRTFLDLQFGIGTAMAWMLGALLIGFTAYQLKMLATAEFRAAGTEKTG